MLGGAIPASSYSSLILVGLRHAVIGLHASLSSGSSVEACGDQAQTGNAYSVAEGVFSRSVLFHMTSNVLFASRFFRWNAVT